MSAWYAQETYVNGHPVGSQTGMSWLDGVNNWGKYIKAGPCHADTTDSAGPYRATFSGIRIGSIGSTLRPDVPTPPTPPPAPTPAVPTPAPGPASCTGCGHACNGDCSTCGVCTTSKCDTEALCMGPCNSGGNAMWCGGGGTPTPAPPPPAPTPAVPTPASACPGGSLAACMDLCPSNPPAAYQACVQDCVKRCT
jgi:hypothetical protein